MYRAKPQLNSILCQLHTVCSLSHQLQNRFHFGKKCMCLKSSLRWRMNMSQLYTKYSFGIRWYRNMSLKSTCCTQLLFHH